MRLWDTASGRSLASLQGRTGAIMCVGPAGDARSLASGRQDGTEWLWEVPGGRLLTTLKRASRADKLPFQRTTAASNSLGFNTGTAIWPAAFYAVRSPGVLRSDPPGLHTAVMDTGPRRVVLDTNVFVAAGFNPGSHSARLVEAVRDGRLRMVWDDATHTEIEHVMRQIPRLSWTRIADLCVPRAVGCRSRCVQAYAAAGASELVLFFGADDLEANLAAA